MKRIPGFFVLPILISFGLTFCVKEDQALEELETSINVAFHVYGTVTDLDGNNYKTIEIGNQTWMAENLKTTRYNDSTLIPNVTDWSEWTRSVNGIYCWYNNNEDKYRSEYGAIYNGFAVMTGKLCPTGWHVPELSDWKTLVAYLGGMPFAGGKLKESGTGHWEAPNTGATNLSGFMALPGGARKGMYDLSANVSCYPKNNFNGARLASEWWSATADAYLPNALAYLGLCCDHERILGLGFREPWGRSPTYGRVMYYGCYVRCVKDD